MNLFRKNFQLFNHFTSLTICLLGIWVLVSAKHFSELGKIFPKIVGFGFIICALALTSSFLLTSEKFLQKTDEGMLWRKYLFMIYTLIWALSLPIFGYLATSIPAFFLIAITVPRTSKLYLRDFLIILFSALAVPLLIFVLLTLLLSVPLPEGRIFY